MQYLKVKHLNIKHHQNFKNNSWNLQLFQHKLHVNTCIKFFVQIISIKGYRLGSSKQKLRFGRGEKAHAAKTRNCITSPFVFPTQILKVTKAKQSCTVSVFQNID